MDGKHIRIHPHTTNATHARCSGQVPFVPSGELHAYLIHRLKRTKSRSDRFPGRGTYCQSSHQRSHHQQQEKATGTVANNTAAQRGILLSRHPAELATLRSTWLWPGRLGGPRLHSVVRGRTSSPHHPVPELCIHPSPSSGRPANMEALHLGTVPGVPDRVRPPAPSHGPSPCTPCFSCCAESQILPIITCHGESCPTNPQGRALMSCHATHLAAI